MKTLELVALLHEMALIARENARNDEAEALEELTKLFDDTDERKLDKVLLMIRNARRLVAA